MRVIDIARKTQASRQNQSADCEKSEKSEKSHFSRVSGGFSSRDKCEKRVAPWDAAVADALLAELRLEVDGIARSFNGGAPPPALATLLADAVRIGERYIRDHDAEASRGWDALELLRELVPHVRECERAWPKAS